MKKTRNIKSSKLSIKFANANKKVFVKRFVDEYELLVKQYIDLLWDLEKVPSLLPKEITSLVKTDLSARIQQCAGKQAAGIVRGTRKKQEQRMWRIKKLYDEGRNKQARKLEAINKKKIITKCDIKNIECELDERFVKIDFENYSSFDGWITISSIGDKQKLILPVKKTKHFNNLNQKTNTLLKGIRLSRNKITFNFEIGEILQRTEGQTLGIDIGKKDAISCSNGFQSSTNKHNQNLDSIINQLAKKKKGSKSFLRKQQHRKNYVNWTINQLNLDDIKKVKLENIKNLRKGKRTSRSLQGWTYTEIFEKLKDKCLQLGVQVEQISPTYTSQRCSVCGRVRKANRKGKWFKCDHCHHEMDSDLNASLNIALDLPGIFKEIRLMNLNRKGFFWLESGFFLDSLGLEPIIPNTQKIK